MFIYSRNTLDQYAPKTYTTFNEVAGTNVIRWKNPSAFAASWGLQIGETGEEQTEVVVLSSSTPGGTAGTLSANTLYEHPANTPIYGIKYDQVVFEKSTTGTSGAATPITNGTLTYQADSEFTLFDDTSGTTTHAYKTFYRSSGLSVNTTESDWITSGGFSFYSLAGIRQRIKDKLWTSAYIKDDLTIDNWVNEWKDEMTNAIISINENYAMGTVGVGFGTAGFGTVTTADFKQIRRFWVTYDGVSKFRSAKMDPNDYLPDQTFSSAHPYHTFHGDSIFEVRPAETGGTAEIEFYRFGTTMVNDTDELPLPMRSYTKSFVNYGLAQALFKDGRKDEYRTKMEECVLDKIVFIKEATPRDKSEPTMIDIVDPINSMSDII